jgi:hypothetical protein
MGRAADSFFGPGGVQANLVNVPVVWRGHDPAVVPGGLAGDGVRLEFIQPQRVVRPVWFTQPVSEIHHRAGLKSLFQLIREHALPAHLSHLAPPDIGMSPFYRKSGSHFFGSLGVAVVTSRIWG